MPTAMIDTASQQQDSSGVAKASDAVVKALAGLYTACHQAQPDSPKCQAVMSLMQAVAEISRPDDGSVPPGQEQKLPMSPDAESPQEDAAEPPDAEMQEGEAGPPPASIADAAGQTHAMMLNAAKRRQG